MIKGHKILNSQNIKRGINISILRSNHNSAIWVSEGSCSDSLCLHTCNPMLILWKHVDLESFQNGDILAVRQYKGIYTHMSRGPLHCVGTLVFSRMHHLFIILSTVCGHIFQFPRTKIFSNNLRNMWWCLWKRGW